MNRVSGLLISALLLVAGCDQPKRPALDGDAILEITPREHTITVGDPADFLLTLWSKEPATFPDLSEQVQAPVRLLNQQSGEAIEVDTGLWRMETHISLTSFRTNETYEVFNTNRIALQFSEPMEIALPFATINMDPVLTNDTAEIEQVAFQPLDLRGPAAKARFWKYLTAGFVACALVLVAMAIALHYRRKAGQKPPPPPRWDLIALHALQELKTSSLWTSEDLDAVAVALSNILRHYIEGRFSLHAPESTTEEFLEQTRGYFPWGPKQQQVLIHFLERTDAIKFAGDRPPMDRLSELHDAVEAFVHATPAAPDDVGEAMS